MEWEKIGVIAFYVGLILAVIIAIISAGQVATWAVIVLGILGVIVGLLNVTDKETIPFLVATIGFLVSFAALSSLISALALGWTAVQTFFILLQVFVAPAAAIVAIKTLYEVTKNA